MGRPPHRQRRGDAASVGRRGRAADGLEFSAEVTVEPITVEDRYPGVRAVIETSLAGARMRLQLDIGVADIAVPEPGWVDYPTLLDMDAPRILAYQPATAVGRVTQWGAFVRRLKMSGVEAPGSLADVVDAVAEFVMPVAVEAAAGEPFELVWARGGGWSASGR
jgi:hypothetical protein